MMLIWSLNKSQCRSHDVVDGLRLNDISALNQSVESDSVICHCFLTADYSRCWITWPRFSLKPTQSARWTLRGLSFSEFLFYFNIRFQQNAFLFLPALLVLSDFCVNPFCFCHQVMVIVAHSDTFEFVFPDNEELSTPNVRHVSVGSQNGASVLIPIRPLVLGEIPISVKAMSSEGSDFVRMGVLVKVPLCPFLLLIISSRWSWYEVDKGHWQ